MSSATREQGRFCSLRVTGIFLHKLEGTAPTAARSDGLRKVRDPGRLARRNKQALALPVTEPDFLLRTLGSFWSRVCGTVPGRAATSIGLEVYKLIRPQLRRHRTHDLKSKIFLFLLKYASQTSISFVCFILEDESSQRRLPQLITRVLQEDPLPSSSGDPDPTLPCLGRASKSGDVDHVTSHRNEQHRTKEKKHVRAMPPNPSSSETRTALSLCLLRYHQAL